MLIEDLLWSFSEDHVNDIIKSRKRLSRYEWNNISWGVSLSEKFIELHKNEVNWRYISSHQILSEKFIEKFSNKVNWSNISCYQELSEKFIERYKDKIVWSNLLKYYSLCSYSQIADHRQLSEKFIRRHSNKLDWNDVCHSQELSIEFIEEFKSKIDWYAISINRRVLTSEFYRKYQDKNIWKNFGVCAGDKLFVTDKFCEEFDDKIKQDENDSMWWKSYTGSGFHRTLGPAVIIFYNGHKEEQYWYHGEHLDNIHSMEEYRHWLNLRIFS